MCFSWCGRRVRSTKVRQLSRNASWSWSKIVRLIAPPLRAPSYSSVILLDGLIYHRELRSNAIMPKTATLSPEVAELELQLTRRGIGEILDVTALTRALYSSDASLYRVVPQAVARPRTVEDVAAVLDAARAAGMPVTTRGAGTSCAGNAVGPGLILDTSRYLNTIVDI